MTKFTPGPWVVQDETVVWTAVIDPPETSYDIGTPVADVRTVKSLLGPSYRREEIEANARLISSAPELYEALKSCLAFLEDDEIADGRVLAVDMARAALSKAEGGT